ncbi:hypothetical protein ASPTUDRAFT_503552 [Aspergillus tubingensis CBS 134.48]|uniref:Uncharacterized protein n=1 Tax=Aspergillus tubingensis (strain CBS 134.48) TaxID=767770 RepID=A0A1L9NCD4_ASPTC|nr:hypothetical protein ASPTUDRAFT_503552 [Aspergillus tubingensis CBS 134.48]
MRIGDFLICSPHASMEKVRDRTISVAQEQQEQRERDTATELLMDGLAGRKEGNQDEPAASASATATATTMTTTKAASFVPPAKPRTTT